MREICVKENIDGALNCDRRRELVPRTELKEKKLFSNLFELPIGPCVASGASWKRSRIFIFKVVKMIYCKETVVSLLSFVPLIFCVY